MALNGNTLTAVVFCVSLLGGAGGATAYMHTHFATAAEVQEVRDIIKEIYRHLLGRPWEEQKENLQEPARLQYIQETPQWNEPNFRAPHWFRYYLAV